MLFKQLTFTASKQFEDLGAKTPSCIFINFKSFKDTEFLKVTFVSHKTVLNFFPLVCFNRILQLLLLFILPVTFGQKQDFVMVQWELSKISLFSESHKATMLPIAIIVQFDNDYLGPSCVPIFRVISSSNTLGDNSTVPIKPRMVNNNPQVTRPNSQKVLD